MSDFDIIITVGSSRVVEFSAKFPNSSVYVTACPLSACGGIGGPLLLAAAESCCGELLGGSANGMFNE